jgi:hypothetical protein
MTANHAATRVMASSKLMRLWDSIEISLDGSLTVGGLKPQEFNQHAYTLAVPKRQR